MLPKPNLLSTPASKMVLKFLILTLFCLFYQTVFCDQKSLRTPADDAFSEFNSFSSRLQQTVRADLVMYGGNIVEQYNQLETVILETLNAKLDVVESKIQQIDDSLKNFGINDCTSGYFNEIEDLREKLTTRVKQCTGMSSNIVMYVATNQSFSDLGWQFAGYMSCYSRARTQCNSFAKDESDYNDYVERVDSLKLSVENAFDMSKAKALNRIFNFKPPCQDLLNFQISIYPDYIVETVNDCAQRVLRNFRPYICPL